MGRLFTFLFPFIMVVLGIFLAVNAAWVMFAPRESSPTPVQLADVENWPRHVQWLKITGGGLYVPGMMIDKRVNPETKNEVYEAYYVPLVSEEQAAKLDAAGLMANSLREGKEVWIRFSPGQFHRKFGSYEQLDEGPQFLPLEPDGKRRPSRMMTGRMENFVRQKLGKVPDDIVLFEFENRPMAMSQAALALGAGLAFAAIGGAWILIRFKSQT